MKRLQLPLLILILALSSTLAFSTMTFGHLWGDDFASYIMQASSILNGSMHDFIAHNTFTIENSTYPPGPVAYPWGYPLLLAPIYALRGLMPYALKMVNIPLYLIFLVSFYFFLKRRFSWWQSLLLIAAFAFNVTFLKYLDQIISDIAFTATSMLALWAIDLYAFDDTPSRTKGILSGIAVFSAYFLRTVGILLLAVLFVYRGYKLFSQKKLHKDALLSDIWPFATFAALWIITSLIFPSGEGSYFSHYGLFDYGQRLQSNFVFYFNMGAEFFMGVPARAVVYGLALAFFLTGFVTSSETDQVTKLYFAASMLLYLSWPEPQGIRFLFPLLPIFVYFSFLGMKTSFFGLSARYRQMGLILTYTFWGAAVAFMLLASTEQALTNLSLDRDIKGPFDPFAREMVKFVDANIPKDSVIIFFKPRAMRLLTGRDSILIDQCEQIDRGDYVIINLDRGEFAEENQLTPGQLKKCGFPITNIFENRKFIVFELEK